LVLYAESSVIRLSRLADYGIVIMTSLARHPGRQQTAAEIAADSAVPAPMASKILKTLARAGLLESHRGAHGGYGLARSADRISVADVIMALDGPIALTACVEDGPGGCDLESLCVARSNWQRINDAVRSALDGISVDEMARSVPAVFLQDHPAMGRAGTEARGGKHGGLAEA
jgi:FeS assembly SUF system regulator